MRAPRLLTVCSMPGCPRLTDGTYCAEHTSHYGKRAWTRKAKEIRQRDGYRCVSCGSRDHLLVHHRDHLGLVGPYGLTNTNLVTLCARCHGAVHAHD
jgi:5-methylcytosine-specific restriction protein A